MRHFSFILLALIFVAHKAAAQQTIINANVYGYWEDVIQFSNQYGGGTARMQALQNAQTGLGGDISNTATNPAGLGLLRKSEFSISPSLLSTNTLSTQAGAQSTGRGSNFNFGQIGYSRSTPTSDAVSGAFRGGTFAITLQRQNNFNNYRTFNTDIKYDGKNPNSYIDQYLDNAGQHQIDSKAAYNGDPNRLTRFILGTPLAQNQELFQNEYETRYAYGKFLLDTVNVNGTVKYVTRIPAGDVNQRGRIYDRGYQNQIDMAYGANFNNKLYIGGGIGVPYLNATRQILYTETLLTPASTNPQALQYTGFSFDRREELTWSGIGFNAKLGAILKVNDHIRIGASAQTPTWYSIRNEYSFSLDPRFVNANGNAINYDTTFSTTGPPSYTNPTFGPNEQQVVYRIVRTNYSMRTPALFSVGVSALDGKWGFVSAQLSIQPYSMARLGGNTYNGDNAFLKSNTVLAKQIRLGAEYILTRTWRLRGGLSYLENPVKKQGATVSYSFGGGVRNGNWYIDGSANIYQQSTSYTIFSYAPRISTIANNVQTMVTVGTFF